MLFSSTAYAHTTAAAPRSQFDFMGLLPLVLVFGIFYFVMIRPQMRKQKDHQTVLNALKVGDKIITSGGIIGAITKIESDTILHIEVAPEVRIRVLRSTISDKITTDIASPLASAGSGGGTKTKSRKKSQEAAE